MKNHMIVIVSVKFSAGNWKYLSLPAGHNADKCVYKLHLDRDIRHGNLVPPKRLHCNQQQALTKL